MPVRHEGAARAAAAVDARSLEATVRQLEGFGTRHSFSKATDPSRGIGAARSWLLGQLRAAAETSDGRMTVTSEPHEIGERDGVPTKFVNLVATIRGTTDPDRIYVLSGHYDSRATARNDASSDAPGANDDGSGTAAIVELARVLARIPLRATVRLVCYDGEELGLIGSRADAKVLEQQDAEIDGMATLDIVGNTRAADGRRERGYVRVFSYQEGSRDSTGRNLARTLSDLARRYFDDFRVKLILRGDRYGRGGDHRPFAEAGFPAVRMTEPYEDFTRQHKDKTERDGKPYGDYADYMDFDYLARVTRLAAVLAVELADAPPAPVAPRVAGTATLDTRVTWRVSDRAESLAGFEVLWRATTEADWTDRRFVPNSAVRDRAGELVLDKVLVDDVVVALRAVGRDGARSRMVSAPEPGALGRR
ncbi:MAG: M28 family peptidase [Planctomycetes bacterium]|nr:M28 family peptidase [Planctomycetota bacterium]MCB9891133.1 M28 family peptidase [Planctomycetota bacterium]